MTDTAIAERMQTQMAVEALRGKYRGHTRAVRAQQRLAEDLERANGKLNASYLILFNEVAAMMVELLRLASSNCVQWPLEPDDYVLAARQNKDKLNLLKTFWRFIRFLDSNKQYKADGPRPELMQALIEGFKSSYKAWVILPEQQLLRTLQEDIPYCLPMLVLPTYDDSKRTRNYLLKGYMPMVRVFGTGDKDDGKPDKVGVLWTERPYEAGSDKKMSHVWLLATMEEALDLAVNVSRGRPLHELHGRTRLAAHFDPAALFAAPADMRPH